MANKKRCAWVSNDPIYEAYHDQEWGKPCYDKIKLFEMLNLEGMQAGLSWITILKRRENYRQAFHNFDAYKIAELKEKDVDRLMQNEGIIRHRKKIEAIINNAHAFCDLEHQGIDFSKWLWQIVEHQPIQNHFNSITEIPAQTDRSQQLSKQLKKSGFKFVGPTICYAFMQAVGMVNDHTTDCFLYR